MGELKTGITVLPEKVLLLMAEILHRLMGNLPMFIHFFPSLFRAVYTQIGAGF